MSTILTLTPNPALDAHTDLDRLEANRKLRCGPLSYDPGGGGVNVARAIRELGGEARAWVAEGGPTGAMLCRLMRAEGLEAVDFDTGFDTRLSMTVRETASGDLYRFVPPGPSLDAACTDRLLAHLGDCLKGADWVVLSGSMPPEPGPDLARRIAQAVRKAGGRLIADTSGDALHAVLEGRPCVLHIDEHEATDLAGRRTETLQQAAETAKALVDQGRAEIVIATAGAEGAGVASPDGRWGFRPPHVEVNSAVGAGDSFVAALTLWLARGKSLPDAARAGVAAAAAAVTTGGTELCRREDVERLLPEVTGGPC